MDDGNKEDPKSRKSRRRLAENWGLGDGNSKLKLGGGGGRKRFRPVIGPFHGIRFVSDRTFTGFFPS